MSRSAARRRTVPLIIAALVAALLALAPGPTAPAGAQDAITSFTPVAELYGIQAGYRSACAIDDNDELYCWGSDTDGQLGNGPGTANVETPGPVAVAGTPLDGKEIEQVALGYTHACARSADHVIACWGGNNNGELGNATTTNSDVPVAVAVAGTPLDGKAIADLDLGLSHSCALATDGTVGCWGFNGSGGLGNGGSADSSVPVALTTTGTPLDGLTIDTLAVGGYNTCAMSTTNVLACTGTGFGGVLGNGGTSTTTTPVSPTIAGTPLAGKTIDLLDVGRYNVCVTTTDDDLICWGNNDAGQVGDGTTIDRDVPTAVATAGTPLDGKAIAQVAAGLEHACARTTDHVLACWGQGNSGQLGNGANSDSSVPVAVDVAGSRLEGFDIDEVAAGDDMSCATNQGAQPSCWGLGGSGQLGDGASATSNTPRPVTLSPDPPGAPVLLSATDDGDGDVQVSWSPPTSDGGSAITGYRIDVYLDGNPTPVDSASAAGFQTTAFVQLDTDTTYRFRIVASNIAGDGPASNVSDPVYTEPNTEPELPDGALYVPITPCRILDTRKAGGTIADREIREISVADDARVAAQGGKAGGCAVPTGAVAVEASITAVSPLNSGFFRAWPAGQSMPDATFMNFDRGMDITNTGSIAVAPLTPEPSGATPNAVGDQLRIRNFGGASHYVIDLQGFYVFPPRMEKPRSPAETSAVDLDDTAIYLPITPCRILDTRKVGGTIANREIRDISVADDARVAAQGGKASGCDLPPEALAIEASITAVSPLDSGFFRAWPAGQSMPDATFMNFDRGMDITNTGSIAVAPLTPEPSGATPNAVGDQLRIRNFGGASHYVADIQGVWMPAFDGPGNQSDATTAAVTGRPSLYEPMTPCRILDTRKVGGTLANREIRDISFTDDARVSAQGGKAGGCGVPTGAVAVEASITAVSPLDSGFFRAWPAGQSMPDATFMNFDRGMDITNTGSLTIALDDEIVAGATTNAVGDELRIRNFGGASHYVIDIQGYYPGVRRPADF